MMRFVTLALTFFGYLVLAAGLGLCFPQQAHAQTVAWQGVSWTNTYPSNGVAVQGSTLVVSTGDASTGYVAGAFHELPASITAASDAWVETTFIDTGEAPGPQIAVVLFESVSSRYIAWLGVSGDGRSYMTHRRRDASTPDQALRPFDTVVGTRSPGLHTATIGRRADGRLEFWLDRKLVDVSPTGAFPAMFNFVTLGALGTAPEQTATFTTYQEGTTASYGRPAPVNCYGDRSTWGAAVSGITTIDFEQLAAPGGFVLYDSSAGVSLGGARFLGMTTRFGPLGPLAWYLRVVDPAYAPLFYDWGSGAVLHGPPIPVGPFNEGGPHSHIRITPPVGTTAAAFDVMSFLNDASRMTMIVSTAVGTRVVPLVTAPHPTRTMVALTVGDPIVSLDIYALDGFPVLDNVSFGRTNPGSACKYSLSSLGQSFPGAGGTAAFDVTSGPGCTWNATVDAPWITLLPGGVCRRVGDVQVCPGPIGHVSYAIAANPSSAARTATISVGAARYTVTQAGAICTFTVAPGSGSIDRGGGYANFTVNAPAGCSVSASSQTSWLTVTAITPGAAGAIVQVRGTANPGAAKTGTVLIAGQTISIAQGIDACGAIDVTAELGHYTTGLQPIGFGSFNTLQQSLVVTNNSGKTMRGPLFAVLVGMPTGLAYPDGAFLTGTQATTKCFSTRGDYLLFMSGDLAPHATTGYQMLWVRQSSFAPINYTVKILSGTPSR